MSLRASRGRRSREKAARRARRAVGVMAAAALAAAMLPGLSGQAPAAPAPAEPPARAVQLPAASVPVMPPVPYAAMIARAADRHGVGRLLLAALVAQESAFDPRAVSVAGARGLTQLMPRTAAEMGVTDPHDPAQALDGGARKLIYRRITHCSLY